MYIDKRKILLRIAMILIVTCCIFNILLPSIVQADNYDLNEFASSKGDETGPGDLIKTGVGVALNVIGSITAGIAVIGIILIGIKYLLSAPDGRAEYKKVFTIYVVGAVLAFAGIKLIGMIASAASGIGG